MEVAPYGSPKYTYEVWKIVVQKDDGTYWLDQEYFSFHYSTKTSYNLKFIDLFGEPRTPVRLLFTQTSEYPLYYGERPSNFKELCHYNQRFADIVASIQEVTEELILALVRQVHWEFGLTSLCLAGGVALNSVANGRILPETPFEELCVRPSSGDGGGALGAAQVAWHCALGNSERFVLNHVYPGQTLSVR